VTNANSSIAAAGFRSRSWEQRLRGVETVLDRRYDAWLLELAMRSKVNPTFKAGLVRHEYENRNE
jgi:hypothetical protein